MCDMGWKAQQGSVQTPAEPSACRQQQEVWWAHDRPIGSAERPGSPRGAPQSPACPAEGVAARTPSPQQHSPPKSPNQALPTAGSQADTALWGKSECLTGAWLPPPHPSPAERNGRVSARLQHTRSISLKFGQDQQRLTPSAAVQASARPWPWLCLRGDVRGEVCADISL